MADHLWQRVNALVDRAHDLAALREHRLELIAARRWRELGRPVPPALVEDERRAAVVTMTAPLLLEKVRAAADGPIVLFKGPEVAARYPDPALRPYGDLDILVPDAVAVHGALKDAGFREVLDPALFVDIHHLRPLHIPPLPVLLEVHSTPKWVDRLEPPPTSVLIAGAVPSSLDVDGILTLRRDHHALVLAVHSWAHEPLRRVLELIDIAAMIEGLDRSELRTLAESWRVERVWDTTLAVTDAVLGDRREPLPLRLWAPNLPAVRRRTVFESHLERWLADFWALPAGAALRTAAVSTWRALCPTEGESWREKLVRARLAMRNASTPRSEHERVLASRRRR
jgi:putative nucleotidyltransferase-like protein